MRCELLPRVELSNCRRTEICSPRQVWLWDARARLKRKPCMMMLQLWSHLHAVNNRGCEAPLTGGDGWMETTKDAWCSSSSSVSRCVCVCGTSTQWLTGVHWASLTLTLIISHLQAVSHQIIGLFYSFVHVSSSKIARFGDIMNSTAYTVWVKKNITPYTRGDNFAKY